MKKLNTLFTGIILFVVIIVTGITIWQFDWIGTPSHKYPSTKYGDFLASQHAIHVNDFARAAEFAQTFADEDSSIVRNTIILSEFLDGKMPENAADLKDEKGTAAQLIYDAYLVQNDKWEDLYKRHKKDESALAAPLRIWSSVATGRSNDALKFIDKLSSNDSWKAFVRGQIYAETGQPQKAAQQFEKVSLDFININDYMYIIAFYNHHEMTDAADKLRRDFTERPGSMYMLNVHVNPQWADFSGYHNELAFSLIQNVSHTQIMMYSDLSIIMLRFAQAAQHGKSTEMDAINYYIGQYFFNNGGDYKKFFTSIETNSPFYAFGMMKIAEKTGKIEELERAANANPLFVPATTKLVARYIQQGNLKKATKAVNRALENKNLTETGRAFYLKTRAQIYLTFGDLESAQRDIRSAADVLPVDAGILATQARIWALQGRELETAYEYAIALVRKNPADVESWDVLGVVVHAREGVDAAMDIIERVAQVSSSCSSLFEHLGDLYVEQGNFRSARDAYNRAIDLSEDGLTIVDNLENKLKALK